MQNVSKEYLALFNAITDAEEALQTLYTRLVQAQREAEELYIGANEDTIEPSAGQD